VPSHPAPPGPARAWVDPNQIANEARDFAYDAGKVRALGNVPGQDAAEIEAARERYLAQNTRPRTLTETIAQKRAYQQRSNYGPTRRPSPDSLPNFDKGVAAANRKAALELDPLLGPDLAAEQNLLGARDALERFHNTPAPIATHGITRHLLLRPSVVGTGAILMDRTGRYVAPDAIRLALLGAMSATRGR